jgi:predicted amidohydrolase
MNEDNFNRRSFLAASLGSAVAASAKLSAAEAEERESTVNLSRQAEHLQYNASAIQVSNKNPEDRNGMKANTLRMLELAEHAVAGSKPFLPVRFIVFPEFAHAAPVYEDAATLIRKLGIEIPNWHTEKMVEKARELNVFIQMGTMLEIDPEYPGALFNTSCLVGPGGILYKYRKVNTWIPFEVHTSPHDIPDYREELFPVAETEIGRIGAAICYDWLFPEAMRQLTANGAEILARVSAYMDPFGAVEPNSWWTLVNRCRALENITYVVAANQGASLRNYPPFSWPGGSMIVDHDGRIVTQATPGDGEKIVTGPVDISMLRKERKTRLAHLMPAHLRTEAYPVYRGEVLPRNSFDDNSGRTYSMNSEVIQRVKKKVFPG